MSEKTTPMPLLLRLIRQSNKVDRSVYPFYTLDKNITRGMDMNFEDGVIGRTNATVAEALAGLAMIAWSASFAFMASQAHGPDL